MPPSPALSLARWHQARDVPVGFWGLVQGTSSLSITLGSNVEVNLVNGRFAPERGRGDRGVGLKRFLASAAGAG